MRTALALTALCGLVAAVLAAVPASRDSDYAGKPAKACPACDKSRVPVCAADSYARNRTFFNKCNIGYFNCEDGSDYAFQAEGECPDDPLVWQYDENEALDPVEVAME